MITTGKLVNRKYDCMYVGEGADALFSTAQKGKIQSLQTKCNTLRDCADISRKCQCTSYINNQCIV